MMIYTIIALSAGLFIYGAYRSWYHYRPRLISSYPARRR